MTRYDKIRIGVLVLSLGILALTSVLGIAITPLDEVGGGAPL